MAGIQLPCTLFETQKWMDDYSAADMRCGDVSDVPRQGISSDSFEFGLSYSAMKRQQSGLS